MDEAIQARNAFAAILKARRIRKNWSQVELAGRCGIDNSYVSQLEKGLKNPTLDVLLRISKAFDIKPERLIKEIRVKLEDLRQV